MFRQRRTCSIEHEKKIPYKVAHAVSPVVRITGRVNLNNCTLGKFMQLEPEELHNILSGPRFIVMAPKYRGLVSPRQQ